MEQVKTLTTLEEIKAFSDPYRMKIILCFRKFDRPATVKQIADEMGETPAKVYYHVKKLEKVGILQLTHTQEINGIVAKYYEPTADSFEIKHGDLDPSIEKLVLSESQRAIHSMYLDSEELVSRQFKHIEELKKDNMNDNKGNIATGDLYLTDEEANKFREYIQNFYKAHMVKNNREEGTKKFHLFTAFFPIIKE